MILRTVLFSSLLIGSTGAAVTSLTPENYDALTEGKTVFIKFFAPWCGHCKKMAPDWEKLADDWNNHDVGLVAEVDCTAAGKALCDENGVRGFPTLKWGDPAGLQDYEGPRGYQDLADFAKDNLKPVCSARNVDLCDEDKKKELLEYMELDLAALETKIEAENTKLEKAEETFKQAVAKLQAEYQKISEEKDQTIQEIKDSGLSLMKSVLTVKKKTDSMDEIKQDL